ncbi:MAG: glycosyltransferase family 2 protein [Candidatus ainarchaeum sp.]|nr:glycosyltransferase family 2 protein [Candidatus ainarchaeum sp.]
MNKKILIIIVNYKKIQEVVNCINSLEKNTYSICLVDNETNQENYEILKKIKDIKLILNKTNRGFAGGNNDAIKKFPNFDYYLLLNSDTKIVEKNWLNTLIEYMEKNKEIGIIGPKLLNSDKTTQRSCGYNTIFGTKPIKGDEIEKIDWISGAVFLIRKEVIKKIGYLDEIYNPAYYEENDYCVRAKKAGFKIVYYPKTKIIHFNKGSQEKLNNLVQRNKLIFILKNFPLHWLLIRIPFELIVFFREFFKEKKIPEQYFFILKNIKKIIKNRKKIYFL